MLQLNDTVKLGIHATSDGVPVPIEWQVYKLHDNLAQLIIKDISIVKHSYSTITRPYDDYEGMSDARWKDSELRKWLNGDFFESSFSFNEKQCVVETIINDNQEWEVAMELVDPEENEVGYSLNGSFNQISTQTTRDRIFIPKLEDITDYTKYNEPFLNILKKWNEKWFDYFTVLNICKIRYRVWNYRTHSPVYRQGEEYGSHIALRHEPYSSNKVYVSDELWSYNCPREVCIPVMVWIDINKYDALNA